MPKQVSRLAFQYLREIQGLSLVRVYIIRCVAVWKEMGFIDRIYQTPKLTNSQRISLPSPLGEGLGVRLFFPLLRHHHHFNPIPLRH